VPPTEFFKQAVIYPAALAEIKKWCSRCGRFAISAITSPDLDNTRYVTILIATNKGEQVIGRNKSLRAAVEFWESLDKKGKVRC
jgi:hypothetical protein